MAKKNRVKRKITQASWNNYRSIVRKLCDKAEQEITSTLLNERYSAELVEDVVYAVVQKYAEGSSELACQLYDAIAEMCGANVPAAEPAATATKREVSRAMAGERLRTNDAAAISSAAGRYVKLASLDTMLKNALRDGAEWAWIPSGDTCPFCLMLASNGWQRASKDAIKNGHAEHIHNNCDCNYVVRFSDDVTVEGYDPDALYEQYINAGDTQWERINALRRQQYAANKDAINARKRMKYRLKNTNDKGNVFQEYMRDANPGIGKITKDIGYLTDKGHVGDEESAQWLINTIGGDVKLLKERRGQGLETADAFWKNAYIEFKKPTSENAMRKRVRKGTSQIAAMGNPDYGRMLIDISERNVSQEKMIAAMLDEAPKRSKQKTLDLIVRDNDEIVGIYRIKK